LVDAVREKGADHEAHTDPPRPRSAWLAVPGEPDGALLLHHMSQSHPREVGRYLEPMHTIDDLTPAIVQAYSGFP
jgi:hypothetical protein